MSRQIVIGVVVTVLAAIILAAIGLQPDGSARDDPDSTFDPGPRDRSPATATVCNSTAGTCPLLDVVAVGDFCVCFDEFGFEFPGTAS